MLCCNVKGFLQIRWVFIQKHDIISKHENLDTRTAIGDKYAIAHRRFHLLNHWPTCEKESHLAQRPDLSHAQHSRTPKWLQKHAQRQGDGQPRIRRQILSATPRDANRAWLHLSMKHRKLFACPKAKNVQYVRRRCLNRSISNKEHTSEYRIQRNPAWSWSRDGSILGRIRFKIIRSRILAKQQVKVIGW